MSRRWRYSESNTKSQNPAGIRPSCPSRARASRGPALYIRCVPEVTTERRWRTFADVVAFALGTNVWISTVILPAIFIGALHKGSQIAAAALPFAVLMLGL